MYDVERSPRFSSTINDLKTEFPRVEAPITAVCAILRNRGGEGFGGVSVAEDWRYFKVDAAPGVPGLNVFFRVDESQKKVFLIRADRIGVIEQCASNGDPDED